MPLHKNEITRTILLDFLVEGICKIAFVKRDGTLRIALATLNYDLIPSQYTKSVDKIFLPDAKVDILPFWDVTQGAWKSFYVNSVELFINAKELTKNTPDNKQKHEKVDENNKDADDIQDMDDNKKKNLESSQQKSNKFFDKSRNEKDVDPVNRIKTRSAKLPRNTRSSITEQYEKHKKDRENAIHILNRLRAEAIKRKDKK
jgi:hypothetical protein